jgi:hypothetical protein
MRLNADDLSAGPAAFQGQLRRAGRIDRRNSRRPPASRDARYDMPCMGSILAENGKAGDRFDAPC